MSVTTRRPIPNFIPETAPFTPEQRTWLDGLFAGLVSLDDGVVPLSSAEAASLLPGLLDGVPGKSADADDDAAPWHDPSIVLDERIKLVQGRPLRRRMMAAMAQQDCGQCGYNCKDYSDAIASKSEARLNLCVPGGKETARMLKALYEEIDKAPASPSSSPAAASVAAAVVAEPGRSRDNPIAATFLSRRLLNKPGSEKETWHIEFDLSGCGLDYVVGD